MRGTERRALASPAAFICLLGHVSLLHIWLSARGSVAAEETTTVVLSVPRGIAPYVSTLPTKFVQADFQRPVSQQDPLQLFVVTGAVR